MSIRSTAAHAINNTLEKLGYRITRIANDYSLHSAFLRLVQRPVPIKTIIDIGASDGRWSEIVRPFYPNASYFLVEANPFHEQDLKNYKKNRSSVDYILAAAGDYEGEIFFDSHDPFGGVASPTPQEGYVRVPVTTIDTQVKQHQLQPPFLIKLDTHGFEIPILNGAQETLQQTNLLVIETYNFHLLPTSLRFHEMCSFMESKGFRVIDLVEPLHRPSDQALWQFDLMFIREDRPEFRSNSYT